jgi:hypothetical protein
MASIWLQHQLWDGTYDFGDLMDAHEFLDVKHENEIRYREWLKKQLQ